MYLHTHPNQYILTYLNISVHTCYHQTPGMTLPEELVALLAEEAPKKKVRSKKTKKAAVATGTEDA